MGKKTSINRLVWVIYICSHNDLMPFIVFNTVYTNGLFWFWMGSDPQQKPTITCLKDDPKTSLVTLYIIHAIQSGLHALDMPDIKLYIYMCVCVIMCYFSRPMLIIVHFGQAVYTFYFHYNIWGCMCSTGPFQYRWLKGYVYSSCYYHRQIGSIHRSHCYHIFPWLCVWDDCYIIFCYLLQIQSGKTRNLFSLLLCSLWWVQIVRYVLTWRSYSFICT